MKVFRETKEELGAYHAVFLPVGKGARSSRKRVSGRLSGNGKHACGCGGCLGVNLFGEKRRARCGDEGPQNEAKGRFGQGTEVFVRIRLYVA